MSNNQNKGPVITVFESKEVYEAKKQELPDTAIVLIKERTDTKIEMREY